LALTLRRLNDTLYDSGWGTGEAKRDEVSLRHGRPVSTPTSPSIGETAERYDHAVHVTPLYPVSSRRDAGQRQPRSSAQSHSAPWQDKARPRRRRLGTPRGKAVH